MTQKVPRRYINALRRGYTTARRRIGVLAMLLAGIAAVTHADNPTTAGLDGRVTIGAYMNGILPTAASDPMPLTLTATGVFTSTPARTPHPGLVPFELNSPLWTDGALKSRFIALPFDSNDPNNATASPRIGFMPSGSWTFPNGTVIVKNFDMQMNEQANTPATVRRLETRILIRNADGTIRGASYRWQAGYSEADLVPARQEQMLGITNSDGSIRTQNYTYPGPDDCVTCHNANAGMVLGIRTSQLNGDLTYPTTRTDNQLHTWDQIGMFNVPINAPATYARSVAIDDTSATLEHRVRSYLSSNCAHCHQPNGIGPFFDMRFETATLDTGLFTTGPDFCGTGIGLIRKYLTDSRLFIRDSAPSGIKQCVSAMPPIARNVPDQRVLGAYNDWVNYGYDVVSAMRLGPTQVKLVFNRPIEAIRAVAAANYALNNGASVTNAAADADPAAVILTTSVLAAGTSYTVKINNVKELQVPQNPIWPNTSVSFTTPGPTVPDAPVLNVVQAGNGRATLSFTAPIFDGGAAITSYFAACASTIPPATLNGTGNASPIAVAGLTNGIQYSCSVLAANSQGPGAASNALPVTPFAPVPTLLNAFSRKVHGGAGTFDLPLNRTAALNGPVTVESRVEATHAIVFRFDIPLSVPGAATTSSGSVTAVAIGGSTNNEVIVTLSGINDRDRVTVSLTNVNGAGVVVSVSLGFLVGDVNSSGAIDPRDLSAIKARAGQRADTSNFWFDLNLSGSVTASEVAAVKARVGRTLN